MAAASDRKRCNDALAGAGEWCMIGVARAAGAILFVVGRVLQEHVGHVGPGHCCACCETLDAHCYAT
jgi:hypothetical protein